MDELKSWLPAIVPTVIFILIPVLQWLFAARPVRREDLDAAIQAERLAREGAIKDLATANGRLADAIQGLHADHRVLVERLSALPTQASLATVTGRLDRITGLLEARLGQLDRLQGAVDRHDDIFADAARAASGRARKEG